MKIFFTYIFFLLTFIVSFAQINEQDTVVYPKVFWNQDDVKIYNFKTKEIKVVQEKVEQEEEISYQVTVKVSDVFEDEKTICWTYDSVKFNSEKFINNPFSLFNQIQVSFIIDKDGRFERFVNLDKTIDALLLSAERLQNEHIENPEIFKQINDLTKFYAKEDQIIKIFEKDINQFHLFYGNGEFKPQSTKIEFTSYLDNLFSTSPTPAKTIIQLNDISLSGTNYVMNSYQVADKEWLANSWFIYLKNLAEKLGTDLPDQSRLNDEIIYNVKTNSRIKDNGWLSYSKEIKKVYFQDTDYTLERIIELKDF